MTLDLALRIWVVLVEAFTLAGAVAIVVYAGAIIGLTLSLAIATLRGMWHSRRMWRNHDRAYHERRRALRS